MMPLMTNECELDRKPEPIEEPEIKATVSDYDDGRGVGNSSNGAVLSFSDEARVSMELDSGASGTRIAARVSDDCGVVNVEPESEKSEARVFSVEDSRVSSSGEVRISLIEEPKGSSSEEVRVSAESDNGDIGKGMESRDCEVVCEEKVGEMETRDAQNDQLDVRGDPMEDVESGNDGSDVTPISSVERFGARDDLFDTQNDRMEVVSSSSGANEVLGGALSEYDSLLSKFDDYVANGGGLPGLSMSKVLSYGFEIGDMVWGKVKSHPWWPGHIFNEAFASTLVRRTKREGYILVAFFGDSSYGWFDPAELIPFDSNFGEKSRQTNSRSFVKAVEEAVDEVSRRRALGLSCKCRNPYNFRQTDVQGYFLVDVADYEPRAIYAESQIKKARDSFQPPATLAFVKQLAMAPRSDDEKGFDSVKNKATLFAYRKATYEEYDETYAQAFGYSGGDRSSQIPRDASTEPIRVAPRAPLSGPLVIAEALGGKMSSAKPAKVKDQSKKDRYLFKRRDEPNSSKVLRVSEVQASSIAPSAYVEGSSAITSGDYVFQKRTPPLSMKPQVQINHEKGGTLKRDGVSASSQYVTGKEAVTVEKKPMVSFPSDRSLAYGSTFATQGAALNTMPSLDDVKANLQEMKVGTNSDVATGPLSTSGSASSGRGIGSFQQEGDRNEGSAKMVQFHEGYQQPKPRVPTMVEGYPTLDKFQEGQSSLHAVPNISEFPGMSLDVKPKKVKKAKVLKRPIGELGSEKLNQGEKKKKRKKEIGVETGMDHPKKRPATGKNAASVGKLAGKAIQIGGTPVVDHQKKENGGGSFLPKSVETMPMVELGNIDLELPQLLNELQVLALDPYHGAESNKPVIVRQVFLKFRSLVSIYQKGKSFAPSTEIEPIDSGGNIFAAGVGVPDNPPNEIAKEPLPKKPPRPLGRPDDPTKGGRKRAPSDRQEEMVAKKLKKLSDLKSLTAEKKAGIKNLEAQRVEGKEKVIPASKPVKADPFKKLEPPAKVVEHTMLVMKFPPRTTLPSGAELKAKFARFGPLDHDSTRIYWKSSTCRVVFLYKADAQKAYKHAAGNSTFFGNVNVRCYLRESGAVENLEPGKGRGEDALNETPSRDTVTDQRPSALLLHPPLQQTQVQLKSCLKKSTADEAGLVAGGNGGNGGGRGMARVKFMLGGEENSRGGEQMMVGNRNNFFNNNNASFADGGASSSSVAMDFISKNFQKVIPPPSSLPPILPLPAQFAKPPQNMHFTELSQPPPQPQKPPPRITHNFNAAQTTAAPPPAPPTVDISHQMISLLTRCSDVVGHVTAFLGYVPYHPL